MSGIPGYHYDNGEIYRENPYRSRPGIRGDDYDENRRRESELVERGSTGGWGNWKTIDSCDTFELTKGDAGLRIEWSGTASSLVNLNWVEFSCLPEIGVRDYRNPSRARFPGMTISNGRLTLRHSEDIMKISLLSLDGKIVQTMSPLAPDDSIPVGNGFFMLMVRTRNGAVSLHRIINSGK
jgi:hypothetical protein